MILVFDTETTGKADLRRGPAAFGQPRLVQLGFELYATNGTRPLHTGCFIIKPEGFTIPPDVTTIHGISHEIADKIGLRLMWAMKTFSGFLELADIVIAHNLAFDSHIIKGELERMKIPLPVRPEQQWVCTMEATTPLCKIPSPYHAGTYKWPKLTEAHQILLGSPVENAHDALNDLRACYRIYRYLQSLSTTPLK